MGRTYSCWMLNCWCITWPVDFKRLITASHKIPKFCQYFVEPLTSPRGTPDWWRIQFDKYWSVLWQNSYIFFSTVKGVTVKDSQQLWRKVCISERCVFLRIVMWNVYWDNRRHFKKAVILTYKCKKKVSQLTYKYYRSKFLKGTPFITILETCIFVEIILEVRRTVSSVMWRHPFN